MAIEIRHNAAPPMQRTMVQFSTRAVLTAMAAIAVVCAVAAPFLRRMPDATQARLLLLGTAVGVGSLLFVVATCIRRRRVEARSGAPLLVVPLTKNRFLLWMIASNVVQTALTLWLVRGGLQPASPGWLVAVTVMLAAVAGFHVATALFYLWWREAMVSLVFCENGLIFNALRFRSWQSLARCRWDFTRGFLWLPEGYYVSGFVLPEAARDAADEIMRSHVPATPGALKSPTTSGTGNRS